MTIAASAAQADEIRTYHYDRRNHESTMTVTNPPPSEETIYYNGPSPEEKARLQKEFCEKFKCATEIPMPDPHPAAH
jgi:hypothetical protein